MYHEPVLLRESLDGLNIKEGGVYVDATFGGGGHSRELLSRLNEGKLFGFDQDEDAIKNALKDKRFMFINHNYRHMKRFLRYYNALPVDGVIADLGISSHQIDTASRGFSTRFDSDLDMRMNRSGELTAEVILNSYNEAQLTQIFSEYGEVRNTKTLVAKIVGERKANSISNTSQFKQLITPLAERGNENQYYAQVFQALRIEVNDELDALKDFLQACAEVIVEGGRLVVIAYHSLEDRLVKNFISKGRFEGEAEKDLYGNINNLPFRAVTKKPFLSSEEEIKSNPRARSAKMRIAERI